MTFKLIRSSYYVNLLCNQKIIGLGLMAQKLAQNVAQLAQLFEYEPK